MNESPIDRILRENKTVAVVGVSDKPERDSHRVARYLQKHGYRIIPVNPTLTELLGERAYPDLLSVPEPVDVVDIFRRPEAVPAIVEQAIAIGARVVWMQEGVVNEGAAVQARQAGLDVVIDHCMRKEHRRWRRKPDKNSIDLRDTIKTRRYGYVKYECGICGYVYDPEKGDPENGIAPGTAFEDLPDGWVCPECGADKSLFETCDVAC